MARKLFCEWSPLTYRIATQRCIWQRNVIDRLSGIRFAAEYAGKPLDISVYRHNSLIRRRLGQVDMRLQENKAVNLALAAPKLDGILLRPGETFSLWRLVGNPTAQRGYREGLVIERGRPSQGIGGGLCQLSNLIHWVMLHTPLTIVEHHHHDQVDLFPDYNRQIPFGTGTSVLYNYLDYRVRNDTDCRYQLLVSVEGEYLCGEIRADRPQQYSYHIQAEEEFFSQEGEHIYRNGKIIRKTVDRRTGTCIARELLRTNHARVDYPLTLPKHE